MINIISQNGECILNYDNIAVIQCRGQYVHAYLVSGGQPIPIGFFATEERAKYVLNHLIADWLDCPDPDYTVYQVPEK